MDIQQLRALRRTGASIAVVSALFVVVDAAVSSGWLWVQAGLGVGGFVLFLVATLRIEKLERDNG